MSGETQTGCWKWFDGVLKEAAIRVTDKDKNKIDDISARTVTSNAENSAS